MVGLVSLDESPLASLSEKTATMTVYGVMPDGELDANNYLVFQYFPDTIQDTKQVNWSPREIPGASLPIYQWISSGERAVSFTAYFTADVNLSDEAGEGALEGRLDEQGVLWRSPDIRVALAKLRQFMLPTYGEDTEAGTPIAVAPQHVLLDMPGSGIGVTGGMSEVNTDELGSGRLWGVMTQCDITYEALFPNGLPRVVSVALNFVETAQAAGAVAFPYRGTGFEDFAKGGTNFFKWPITDIKPGGRLLP